MSLPDGSLPVGDPALLTRPLRLYDPEFKSNVVDRPLTDQGTDFVSRCLRITAGGRSFEVAPCQHLPIWRGDKMVEAPAFNLGAGDRILVEVDGREPARLPVDSIIPRFMALDQVVVAESDSPGGIANVSTRRASIGFANKIGVTLTLAGESAIAKSLRTVPRGEEGIGDASGSAKADTFARGEATNVKAHSPVLADLQQHTTLISISDDHLLPLLDRGEEILRTLYLEGEKLHGPTDGSNAAWFDELLAKVGLPKLSQAKSSGYMLKALLVDHIKQRRMFLRDEKVDVPGHGPMGGRTEGQFSGILHAQLIVAGLAYACGAERTSEALVRDAIELSVYCGCDLRAGASRLQPDLMLAGVLRYPDLIRGETSDLVALNPMTLDRVSSWAAANKLSQRIIVDNALSRKGLWAYWQSQVSRSPFWIDLPVRMTSQVSSSGNPFLGDFLQWIEVRSDVSRQRQDAAAEMIKAAEREDERKTSEEARYREMTR